MIFMCAFINQKLGDFEDFHVHREFYNLDHLLLDFVKVDYVRRHSLLMN